MNRFHHPHGVAAPLAEAIAAFGGALEAGAHLALGCPQDPEEAWFPFEQMEDVDFARQVIRRIGAWSQANDTVAAAYTLRYAVYLPMLLAGYLFAGRRQVIRLRDRLLLADRDWLSQAVLLSAEALNEPGDTNSRLADRLFTEVDRLVKPVIESWATHRLLARANAWASVLDGLAGGFELYGKHTGSPDASWSGWEEAIAGRSFPVKRRPRRFEFICTGSREQVLVRSGCCLWFTLPAAQGGSQRYCLSCCLEKDDRRLQRAVTDRCPNYMDGDGHVSSG